MQQTAEQDPQPTEPTWPWRVGRRVQFFLSGSGIWAGEDYSKDPELTAAGHSLVAKLKAATDRKDGSCTVKLTPAEATVLIEYVETMADGAAMNTWDSDGRADLAAARGLLAQEHKLPADAVWKPQRGATVQDRGGVR